MSDVTLRMAWRNLWRHKRRTWITVSAMVFSNILLVFMLSLQVGTYQMMIDNSLSLFSGHLQIQHSQYLDTPKLRYDIENPQQLTKQLRAQLGTDAVASRAATFSLVSSDERSYGVQVIGVPKTIDGDIQVRDVDGSVLCAMSFGFHTAARAFASSISNLCTDSSSDVKYWHICKVMGRVASHLALEVALQTHANITLIGEDLANYVDQNRLALAEQDGKTDYHAYGMTLRHLSRVICEGIVKRAAVGKSYGVIVIPEGVLEFINEIQVFIIKLNTIIAEYS